MHMLSDEKISQAIDILNEKEIDLWLTFVRESSTLPDPVLDLILDANCTWPSAFMIHKSGENVAIVGSLDSQNIRDHASYEVIGYVDSIHKPLLDQLNKWNPETIAINTSASDVMADGLTHGMYNMLCKYLEETDYTNRFTSSESIIAALRGRKSQEEVDNIKSAIDETLKIFDEVTEFVKVGMTEQQVAQFIKDKMQEKELEPAWDEDHCPAVFTGPDSAGAHAGPTNQTIEPGHIMNIDFGVRVNGYVSDLQRTWYFLKADETEAPEAVLKGFNTIRDAIQITAEKLKPGMQGQQIDKIARDYIVNAGYDEYPHALGHQVGRKAHDGGTLLCPKWDRYQDLPYSIVESGQVFTIEPRLTVEGHGIATIEEIVKVHNTGCTFLSKQQKELINIPHP